MHFVTTEELKKDLVERGLDPDSEEIRLQYMNLLVLSTPLKRNGCLADVRASDDDYRCLPESPDACFLKFPFTDTASRLNQATKDLVLLNHPLFKFGNSEDEIRECPNDEIREKFVHDVAKAFNTVVLYTRTYLGHKRDVTSDQYTKWFNNKMIEIFSFWSMRANTSLVVEASEIVSPLVTHEVQKFFQFNCVNYIQEDISLPESEKVTHSSTYNVIQMMIAMKKILQYLKSHVDVLTKKFIFFVQNEGENHWWGWAAINPWVQLARILDTRWQQDENEVETPYSTYDQYTSGMLCCDGLNQNRTFKDSLCFIWFLNLASAYRDMHMEGLLDRFKYINHIPKSYWMLGC